MIHTLPDTGIEWIRFFTSMFGIVAFGLLVFRLMSRVDHMSFLSFMMTLLLSVSVLAFGLGSARAQMLSNRFNEIALLGLLVNVGATIVGLFWHRLMRLIRKPPEA